MNMQNLHVNTINSDKFFVINIHLLMHMQAHLQKLPNDAIYGEPHAFESPFVETS